MIEMEIKMKAKMKNFYLAHKQVVLYFGTGIITTVCSLGACFLTLRLGLCFEFFVDNDGAPTPLLDVIGSTTQWICGVLIAFFTNKKWVFTDAPKGRRNTAVQFGTFSLSRVGTYFLEVVLNLGAIGLLDILGYNDHLINVGTTAVNLNSRLWAKIMSSIVVVIVNYIISKKWVFKSKK